MQNSQSLPPHTFCFPLLCFAFAVGNPPGPSGSALSFMTNASIYANASRVPHREREADKGRLHVPLARAPNLSANGAMPPDNYGRDMLLIPLQQNATIGGGGTVGTAHTHVGSLESWLVGMAEHLGVRLERGELQETAAPPLFCYFKQPEPTHHTQTTVGPRQVGRRRREEAAGAYARRGTGNRPHRQATN
jgi:hypothetical protein